jgi:hypothetical protein
MNKDDEVALERDHYWWLHPALRGRETLPGGTAATLPWRWVTSNAEPEAPTAIDASGPYADFAKLLYKMNGYRPGPVTGWYVVVEPEPGRFAVGQLCVDPNVPVVLFEDEIYPSEGEARDAANARRAKQPGLKHTT